MPKISRVFVGVLGICVALAVWGFLIEPSLLIQRDVKLNHWAGPPMRIAFLADLHAGSPHIDEEYIENLVNRINAMSPDIVLIGGDLVINGVIGGHPIPIVEVVSILKKIKAPLGIYSVLGNHDWWNDGEGIRAAPPTFGVLY